MTKKERTTGRELTKQNQRNSKNAKAYKIFELVRILEFLEITANQYREQRKSNTKH
jgi:hypothetical protein